MKSKRNSFMMKTRKIKIKRKIMKKTKNKKLNSKHTEEYYIL